MVAVASTAPPYRRPLTGEQRGALEHRGEGSEREMVGGRDGSVAPASVAVWCMRYIGLSRRCHSWQRL